jgi:hypothetical protein
MPEYRYRLRDEDGANLGLFVTALPDWQPGNMIYRHAGVVLEVVRVVDAEPGRRDELRGWLVVRKC